jgi:hypothetical protein
MYRKLNLKTMGLVNNFTTLCIVRVVILILTGILTYNTDPCRQCIKEKHSSGEWFTNRSCNLNSRAWRQPIIPETEMNRPNVINSEQIAIAGE